MTHLSRPFEESAEQQADRGPGKGTAASQEARGAGGGNAATTPPPVRIGASALMVGTCSWTDQTLVKETGWYPRRSMSASDRLRYYAAHFPIVEADAPYYRPLAPEVARSWAERSPEGFRFNIKAFGLLTGHPVDPAVLWPDVRSELTPEAAGKRRVYSHHLPSDVLEEVWARFLNALVPLANAGRLGAVLFQYPPWFVPKRANREELSRVGARLRQFRGCVEFRAPTWLGEDVRAMTLGLLRELGLALVDVDAPGSSGLPALSDVTNPALAVVRFHGRADELWSARNVTAAERFRYLYDGSELAEWVPRVRRLAEQASNVHLLMNNCYRDYGVRNASQLMSMLAESESQI